MKPPTCQAQLLQGLRGFLQVSPHVAFFDKKILELKTAWFSPPTLLSSLRLADDRCSLQPA